MDDFDFDLGDPAAAVKPTTSKTSRFQPKLKGGKQIKPSLPKPEPEPAPESEPLEIKEPPIVIPNIEKREIEKLNDVIVKEENGGGGGGGDAMQLDGDDGFDEIGLVDGDMETDDDVVVNEVDVYLNASPIDDDTLLYIMQYPLRPPWRPYDMKERERCEEVRVKPKQSKVEVDLRLDFGSEIYDQQLQKQTLSSFGCTSISNIAVGVRIGNQLHLNPVDVSVQLRPSIKCINDGGRRTQSKTPNIHSDTNPSEGEASVRDSNGIPCDMEQWVSLEYHSIDSPFWDRYQRKMVHQKNNDIQLAIKQSDYISFLCPGTSSEKKRVVGPSRRVLLSMPLEERFKKWFSEGPQVNRFISLLYLAPSDPVEDVLAELQKYADLVQGLWVSKSSLLCEGFLARARDYILSQFSTDSVIYYDKKRPPTDKAKYVLDQFAVHRPKLNNWKFKEPTDFKFIKTYPNIVKEQEFTWSCRAKQLTTSSRGAGKPKDNQDMEALIKCLNPHLLKKASDPGKDNHTQMNGMVKLKTRENLIKALLEIFQLQSVRSLNSVVNELNVPTHEIQSVISEVAVDIHGVYILKTLKNPDVDPLRNFVMGIFRQKKANVKFREQDVRKAAQTVLKRNISDSEFNQVVNELCTSKGGLMLKSGDSN